MFQPMLFDIPDLGSAFAEDRAVARPIGSRRHWRPPQRAQKRVAALNAIRQDMGSLVQIMRAMVGEVDALARRSEHDGEQLAAVLRQIVEVRRHLGLTELHKPAPATRRRPLGT